MKFEKIETTELCMYGCGNTSKYVTLTGKLVCSEHSSKCPANKKKNSDGVKLSNSLSKKDEIYYSNRYKNLSTETKDKMAWNRDNYSNVEFILNGKGNHKNALIFERGHICESCNLSEWLGVPITLELEHIDGNNKNNIKENLKLLCPNCHSQTDTWRGKNINSGKVKVSDQILLNSLLSENSIRKALQKVNLTPKGGNYERCYKLLEKYNAGVVEWDTLEI